MSEQVVSLLLNVVLNFGTYENFTIFWKSCISKNLKRVKNKNCWPLIWISTQNLSIYISYNILFANLLDGAFWLLQTHLIPKNNMYSIHYMNNITKFYHFVFRKEYFKTSKPPNFYIFRMISNHDTVIGFGWKRIGKIQDIHISMFIF